MDLVSTSATHTVTVLRVGFDDATEDSLILDEDAGDIWTTSDETGDIVIHLAPKVEKRIIDTTGKQRPVTIAAQPQRTIIWRGAHIKWLEWNQAQATEYPAYKPQTP